MLPNLRKVNFQATKDLIIFPFDHELKRYQTSAYIPAMTDGRGDEEDVDGFLKEVARIYSTPINSRSVTEKKRKAYLLMLLIISFGLYCLSRVLFWNPTVEGPFPFIFGLFGFLLSIPFIIASHQGVSNSENHDKALRRGEAEDFVKRENRSRWMKFGLRWFVPLTEFPIMHLLLDYKNPNIKIRDEESQKTGSTFDNETKEESDLKYYK